MNDIPQNSQHFLRGVFLPQRRLLTLCSAFIVTTMLLLCRLFWIATEQNYEMTATAQAEKAVELPATRGDFFDRSGRRLTGTETQWYALCIPGISSYAALFEFTDYAAQNELYRRRNENTAFLVPVSADLSKMGVFCYAGSRRYLPLPIAVHLIGYLDGTGHGVAGLEKSYDDMLYQNRSESTVTCITNAQGSLIAGQQPTVTVAEVQSNKISLTLDANLQRACEGIAQLTMNSGCIVVMKTNTGEILACTSMPTYNPGDVMQSIEANDTSLINRALAAFDAGSVFKVVLALSAYENNLDWFTHDCKGEIMIGDQIFRCALGRAHGEQNLRKALKNSCNCYFIELGKTVGGDRILASAKEFGLGSATSLAPGLESATGVLPDAETLENEGQQAMFSFGQGQLTVTPLQITAMMNTLASGGVYYQPELIRGISANQKLQNIRNEAVQKISKRICSERTAKILRSMLISVVEGGIGEEAAPNEGTAGGKTGTAQTGRYDEQGNELLNYWFSGFYPGEKPQYTVTILQDGQYEPEYSSAAIFSMVANALHVVENS